MHLLVFGLNHKTASVEIREKFSFASERIKDGLVSLRKYSGIRENLIISTCNRMEIWVIAESPELGKKSIVNFLQDFQEAPLNQEQIEEQFYFYQGSQAGRHLFSVASGLDSLVLGEGQILGQLKEFYEETCKAGSNGFFLNSLFKKAINVGKKVRRETGIGENAISVSTVAVDLAKKFLGNLIEQKVLILGAGEMSELTAKSLAVRGVKSIIVANRNYERAQELASIFGGQAIRFDEVYQYLKEVDIVISSTGAPHYVLHKEELASVLDDRTGKKLFLIDIAVPRDIDPSIAELSNVALYDIDDLRLAMEENIKQREQEAQKARQIIEEELKEFASWIQMTPIVALLRKNIENIRQRELSHAYEHKFSKITEEDQEAVEKLTVEIMNKILDLPISWIVSRIGEADNQKKLGIIAELFNLPKEDLEKMRLELA